MLKAIAAIGAGFLLLAAISGGAVGAEPAAPTPKGRWLAHQLDGLGVAHAVRAAPATAN